MPCREPIFVFAILKEVQNISCSVTVLVKKHICSPQDIFIPMLAVNKVTIGYMTSTFKFNSHVGASFV
jgi:hypothetical protein